MHDCPVIEAERNDSSSLDAGVYFGVPTETRNAGAVTLTLSDYAPSAEVPAHAHTHPYFCYVSAGKFRELGVSGEYVASRGTLVFHPATETHSDEFGVSGARCFNIEVAGDVDIARDAGVVTGRAVRYAAELYREMRAWDTASLVVAEGLASALVARVGFDAELERRTLSGAKRRAREIVSRAVTRLREDPCNPPSLASLAQDAGMATITFARAFRRQLGCGVGAFVRAERVEMAKRALVESKQPVSMIAAELGFADQAHLTRVFRDATGWTPAAFRRAMAA
jgi:AraC family transcriptional regulator